MFLYSDSSAIAENVKLFANMAIDKEVISPG